MFEKILIAEDHESDNLSVQRAVEELQIRDKDQVYYCDDALTKVKIAIQHEQPYETLITDLYFEADGTPQVLTDGFQLIASVRAVQPTLQIIVFSAETKPAVIESLIRQYGIDAYVRKGRNDVKELKAAIESLSKGQKYFSHEILRIIRKSANTHEFSDFDVKIIQLLSQGYQQNQIPDYLKRNNIKPSSLSTIEKRLNQIREELGFTKNEQLVLFCKEMGIL